MTGCLDDKKLKIKRCRNEKSNKFLNFNKHHRLQLTFYLFMSCVFRGKLAEESVDPLSDQRQFEETHPTQTLQVRSVYSSEFVPIYYYYYYYLSSAAPQIPLSWKL